MSFRWLFCPNAARSILEAITIGKTHLSLSYCLYAYLGAVDPWKVQLSTTTYQTTDVTIYTTSVTTMVNYYDMFTTTDDMFTVAVTEFDDSLEGD